MNEEKFIITEREGERLDQFLAYKFPQYSRSYFSNLIKSRDILVNSLPSKSSYRIRTGDNLSIRFIDQAPEQFLAGEEIELNIIFENNDVIVINKQPGLVVHPAAGNKTGTLVHALINHFPKIIQAVYDEESTVSQLRPGLVHRLDKDTSGVIIVAKNKRAMHSLAKQIQNRSVKKIYWGVCYGWPKLEKGQLVSFLGRHPKNRKLIADIGKEKGREAITDYTVLKYLEYKGEKLSLIEFDLKTGRTHQIRVQISNLGNPILGDNFYGNKKSTALSIDLFAQRQLLHAKELYINLPGDEKPTKFEADLPADFMMILDKSKESH